MSFFPPQLLQLLQQSQMNRDQQTVANAAHMPIPGLTGPLGSGASLPVGMAPPQQPLPGVTPTMGNHMMPPPVMGPYGQQALQLAGLLGNRGPGVPQLPVGGQQINPLLGDKSRMPFYRPVGK